MSKVGFILRRALRLAGWILASGGAAGVVVCGLLWMMADRDPTGAERAVEMRHLLLEAVVAMCVGALVLIGRVTPDVDSWG